MSHAPASTTETIYQQLKDMILNFALYPGTRVTEHELSAKFQVSRTPVRAALQRLATEGYVSILPKLGCFVREIDIEEINHYYQVRIALELMAIELAGLNMSDRQLDALAAIWNPEFIPKEPPGVESMVAKDSSFHLELAKGAGNPVLARYLADVNERIHIVRRLDFTECDRISQTYIEHYEIISLLKKRDVDAAKKLLLKHISKSAEVAKAITLTQLAQHRLRSKVDV